MLHIALFHVVCRTSKIPYVWPVWISSSWRDRYLKIKSLYKSSRGLTYMCSSCVPFRNLKLYSIDHVISVWFNGPKHISRLLTFEQKEMIIVNRKMSADHWRPPPVKCPVVFTAKCPIFRWLLGKKLVPHYWVCTYILCSSGAGGGAQISRVAILHISTK